MRFVYRPLPVWPHPVTRDRPYCRFKAPYSRTLQLLEREINALQDGPSWMRPDVAVTLGVGLSEKDIRLDGLPRANARAYSHPGVELSFDSKHGRLTYATDEFGEWEDNLRAIALSLEALRAVNRYGVSKRGQQYTGYALLGSGDDPVTRGRKFVERWGSVREAMRHTHPDTGDTDMTPDDWAAVIAYRDAEAVSA